MTDKAEETSCIHKTNFDQRKKNPQSVKTQKLNLFKDRIV